MTALSFRIDLYSGFALDAAAKAFAEFASIALRSDAERYYVELSSKGDVDERRLADEFANYALGATIERRGPDD